MPYNALVYHVMIASPSDVAAERKLVREVIHDWNAVNSADRKTVLLPVAWESHASPLMGDRPQAIINRQIGGDADLLIAVFWTKLGSPSGRATSGTVEEIEEHLAAGKPVMIYFSNAPVRLDSVDESQYAALKEFRDTCLTRGLCEFYESLDDLRSKLSRQLAQTVMRQFTALSPSGMNAQEPIPSLSAQAASLLVAAARNAQSTVTRIEHASGVLIEAGDTQLFDGYGGREHAIWESALESLVVAGLFRQSQASPGFILYQLTKRGFEVADQLPVSDA